MTDTTPKPHPFTPARNHIAGRAANGDICMNEGRGALVALDTNTRYQIEDWLLESKPGQFQNQYRAALALLDREAEQARIAAGRPRPNTPDVKTVYGKRITVKRLCNGCGRNLGDATKAELDAVPGIQPDVTAECGCTKPSRP